jgi:D-3-phosphoglycerate dehydrogenase
MIKVLVTDNLSPEGVKVFQAEEGMQVDVKNKLAAEELLACIGEYDALVVRSASKVTAEVLEAGKKLKVVGRAGVGLDNVDKDAATARGIVVMNTPGGNTITTAEHTMAMMCSMARKIPQAAASLKLRQWEKTKFIGTELYGKNLGVIGLGRIGTEVAKRAMAFQMKILAYDPFISRETAQGLGIELVDLDTIYKNADFITVHTPVTPDTKNLINKNTIAKMKEGVRIINCARGGIVNEADLYEALKSGKVAAAAVDVYETEPLKDSPLLDLENFVGTPHLGASTHEAQTNVAVEVAQQIIDYLKRGVIRNAANMPSVPPEVMKTLSPYLPLAEKLGSLISQFAEGGLKELNITYKGEISNLTLAPLTTATLKGVLEPILMEGVNYVNALFLAKERGLKVVESKSEKLEDYTSLISLVLKTDKGDYSAEGTLYYNREPHLASLGGIRLDIVLGGYMLVSSNIDVPGVVGRLCSFLGNNKINIADMRLGREKAGGKALAVLNVDTPISDAVLAEIRKMPDIKMAKQVKL